MTYRCILVSCICVNLREIHFMYYSTELSWFKDQVVIDGEQHKTFQRYYPALVLRTHEAYKSSPICLLTLSYFISQR